MADIVAFECLGIYKALYAYTAQGDDEVSMDEDQLVFLLDNSDDDWHKVRVKPASSQEVEGPEGLVPAAYIEKAAPLSTVRAIYDYDAAASGELTIIDGQSLSVHEKEDEWILVERDGAKGKKECGYVPANYVEEGNIEEASTAAPNATTIVVPDSPPRPAYVAPEDRIAAARASADKAKHDPVETWSVSQVDKKGKKKKGTLGVGNGSLFFASESDKTPVQKWQTFDISGVTMDKHKRLEINFADGTESLHFHSKDAAEAIKTKIESSRALSGAPLSPNGNESPRPSTDSRTISNSRAVDVIAPPPSHPAKAVHFATKTSEIPPREDTDDENEMEQPHEMYNQAGRDSEDSVGGYESLAYSNRNGDQARPKISAARRAGFNTDDGEIVVVLYDFTGDASDELSVKEGESLLVLDRSNDDWWKCQNRSGREGVVPAQYVDLTTSDGEQDTAAAPATTQAEKEPSPEPEPEEDSEEEREREREERERERKEKERKERERREREKREADERRERVEREEEARRKAEEKKARAAEKARQAKLQQEEEEKERRVQEEIRAAKQRKLQKAKAAKDTTEDSDDTGDDLAEEARKIALRRQLDKDNARQGRPTSTGGKQHGPPPTGKTRVWHDRTGQFRVEAEFKGYENGKIRLHKLNGVTIEVPSEKMSSEDMRYIAKITGIDTGHSSSKEEPRERGSRSIDSIKLPSANVASAAAPTPRNPRSGDVRPKKRVDWFEFFLNAGCDMDDCTRYAQMFERDKIDESILPDMKSDTLRAIGLREGDIIRVIKAIEKRQWTSKSRNEEPGVKEQIEADEKYAQQVQEAILTGKQPPPPPGPLPQRKPTSPPPNLFAAPNGALKDNTIRRGRPTPSGKSTSINVDENMLANASTRLGTPTSATRSNRTPSPNLIDTGSGTSAPSTKVSGFDDDAWTPRPSSTNPISPVAAVTPPAAPASAPPAPAPPSDPPVPGTTATSPPPRPSTAAGNSTTAALEKELELLQKIAELKRPPSAPAPSNVVPAAPPVPSPSIPPTLTNTLSPGLSPSPGLQPQTTGIFAGAANGVRGPFAPVPANEPVLLKPLIPTNTAMSGFVPTRPAPANTNQAPRPLVSQATGLPQTLGTLQAQATGYQPTMSAIQPQMTAFQPQTSPFQPQPTGFQPNSFQPQSTGLAPLTAQATGVPYGMGTTPSPIPPVPAIQNQLTANPSMFTSQPSFGQPAITTQPLGTLNLNPPASPPANNSPANVFAAMKAGNFGGEEQSAPNYDAMRANPSPNPLASQPTGWVPGFQYR